MIQPEIDQKYGDIFHTDKRLNISKIELGERGSCYYTKMHDWYLHDVELMTGDPRGFEYDKGIIRFWVNGIGTVEKLSISFDCYHSFRHCGEYKGINCLWFRRREKGSPKIPYSELKKIHKNDLLLTFQKFITTAEQLGYLIEEA